MKILFLLIFSSTVFAANNRYFARSPKALLMGDAYTSIAEDEYTLYYNPAILARHKNFSFWAINPQITVSNPLEAEDQFEDSGSTASEFTDTFLDSPIHFGLNGAPGFKMGRFGLTAILNNQTNLSVMNESTPMLSIDHHFDKGFIAGYGFPVNGDMALGLSIKYIERESIFGIYNVVSARTLDLIRELEDADDISEYSELIADAFGKTKGSGWGVDIGWDYVKGHSGNLFTMGFSLIDAYTILHTEDNEENKEVQAQPLKANFGTSYSMKKSGFGLLFSGDLRNLEDLELDFQKRLKLGFELMISPALSALAGYNSGQYSYGIKFNFGLLKTYLGLYGVDSGEKLGQQISKRGVVYVSLFDFNFDV